MPIILETPRLRLRHLVEQDAPLLRLLNENSASIRVLEKIGMRRSHHEMDDDGEVAVYRA